MLNSISWKQFTEFIAWSAGLYYLVMVVRYYGRDILALMTGKKVRKGHNGDAEPGMDGNRAGDQVKSDGNTKNKKI